MGFMSNGKEVFEELDDIFGASGDAFKNGDVASGVGLGLNGVFDAAGNLITLGGAHAIGKTLDATVLPDNTPQDVNSHDVASQAWMNLSIGAIGGAMAPILGGELAMTEMAVAVTPAVGCTAASINEQHKSGELNGVGDVKQLGETAGSIGHVILTEMDNYLAKEEARKELKQQIHNDLSMETLQEEQRAAKGRTVPDDWNAILSCNSSSNTGKGLGE